MKTIFVLILVIMFSDKLNNIDIQTKNFQKVKLKEFYNGAGIIFPEEYNLIFEVPNLEKRFTPKVDDLKIAESLLCDQYNNAYTSDQRTIKFEVVENVRRKFRNYNRQYIGYINQDQERVILIHLLNFSSKKNIRRHFQNWENEYIIGFGDFYEKNVVTFKANLTKKRLELF